MSWSVSDKRDFEKGVQDALQAEIKGYNKRLKSSELRHRDVHEVRKSIKRIRAGIRLMRKDLSKKDYQKADSYFQTIGKALSPLRDTHILQTTIHSIVKKTTQTLSKEEIQKIDKELKNYIAEIKMGASVSRLRNKNFQNALKVIEKDLLGTKVTQEGFESCLKQAYKKAKKTYYLVCKDGHDARIHSYRKKVKYLYNELKLLDGKIPGLKVSNSSLNHLGDLLGHHHDLAFLEQTLKRNKLEFPNKVNATLIKTIRTEKEHVLRTSLAHSALFFQQKWPQLYAA